MYVYIYIYIITYMDIYSQGVDEIGLCKIYCLRQPIIEHIALYM